MDDAIGPASPGHGPSLKNNMRRFPQVPLLRELVLVLIFKLVALAGIRFAFFSDSVAVDAQRIDQVLLHSPQPANQEGQ